MNDNHLAPILWSAAFAIMASAIMVITSRLPSEKLPPQVVPMDEVIEEELPLEHSTDQDD